jgi:uncharacterized membrane protein
MNQNPVPLGRRTRLLVLAIVGCAWVASLVVWPFAPAYVPTHWNAAGAVNGTMPRFPGLFIAPAIMTVLAVLLVVIPRIDPRSANYASFGNTYRLIRIGVLLFLLVVHLLALAAALGLTLNMSAVITPLVGLLFVGLGNVMGKLRPNWFVGIRTPWTLSSADVWTRTHRFGGRVMIVLGIVLILSSLLVPPTALATVLLVGTIGMAALTVGYSYVVWRQLGTPTEQ